MNIAQTNNISFKNTFYLYPNNKNAQKVAQKIDQVLPQYGVSWVEINPSYDKKGRPAEIDKRKTTSKEVISINENSGLDQNVRSFCIKNNIDFVEYNKRGLAEKIVHSAQIDDDGLGIENYSVAIVDTEKLEETFKDLGLDNNFGELKADYDKKSQSIKQQLKAYLKSGEKFKAPYLDYISDSEFDPSEEYLPDGDIKVRLSQKGRTIPSGTFALNGYSNSKITYDKSDIYFALREMGVKNIPVTVNEKTLMLLDNLRIVRGVKVNNEIR